MYPVPCTQVSRVVPGEGGQLEVWASTQDPSYTQVHQHCTSNFHLKAVVARILGLPANKVVVRVKRMGGAFGGKETKSVVVTAAVALAARVTGRPVRCMLDRQEDMVMTGQRHPYLGNFRVAFTTAGLVTGVAVDLYSNGGWCADMSCAVMARSLFHADGSYRVPNLRARGFVCRTNTPSNTAFRGFGLPQVAMVAEGWVEAVADALGLAPEEVRYRNLYQDGDITHFGQQLEGCTLGRCWEECRRMAGWEELQQQVEQFNSANRWKKRGLAMVPVKMGVRYAVEHLNQAGCLLNIYTDGTVLLAHGGTEMGQGLHTKMVQVCAHTLGIHHSKVHVMETSTDKVPPSLHPTSRCQTPRPPPPASPLTWWGPRWWRPAPPCSTGGGGAIGGGPHWPAAQAGALQGGGEGLGRGGDGRPPGQGQPLLHRLLQHPRPPLRL